MSKLIYGFNNPLSEELDQIKEDFDKFLEYLDLKQHI